MFKPLKIEGRGVEVGLPTLFFCADTPGRGPAAAAGAEMGIWMSRTGGFRERLLLVTGKNKTERLRAYIVPNA